MRCVGGGYGSMEKCMWKCSGITNTIGSADSAMIDILPESVR